MSGNSKKAVAAFSLFLLGAVVYTNIYLPGYSDLARENRERTARHSGSGAASGPTKSMWKNMDTHVKEAAPPTPSSGGGSQ